MLSRLWRRVKKQTRFASRLIRSCRSSACYGPRSIRGTPANGLSVRSECDRGISGWDILRGLMKMSIDYRLWCIAQRKAKLRLCLLSLQSKTAGHKSLEIPAMNARTRMNNAGFIEPYKVVEHVTISPSYFVTFTSLFSTSLHPSSLFR